MGLRWGQPLHRLCRPQVLGHTCGAAFGGKAQTDDTKVFKTRRLVHLLVVLVLAVRPSLRSRAPSGGAYLGSCSWCFILTEATLCLRASL